MNVSRWSGYESKAKWPHPAVVEYLVQEIKPERGIRTRHTSEYSYRRPAQHTIYFSDKRVLELLREKFGEHITELMKPINEEHSQAMAQDKVLVRPTLFHGKYRYCIRASSKHITGTYRRSGTHMDQMVKWCAETFSHLEERKDYYIYKGFTKSFFFTNPADVLLMKLTWGDDIDRTERIMLTSELDTPDASE